MISDYHYRVCQKTGPPAISPTAFFGLLLHSSRASMLLASLPQLFLDQHYPGADACPISSILDLWNLCFLGLRPTYPTADQLPLPQATQTQLKIFLPKHLPPLIILRTLPLKCLGLQP